MLNIPVPGEPVVDENDRAETSWYNYWMETGFELRKLIAGGGGIPEAPTDGQLYGRHNAAWTVVPGDAVTSVFGRTGAVVAVAGDYTKSDVGLGSVDNTSDVNKPVSTAQAAADALKANLASPTFTGVPAAPTAGAGTNTAQIASTAFVTAAVTAATYTDEMAQDAVGTILVDSATVDFTYVGATPSISAVVPANAVTNTVLADMATGTVKMRRAGVGTGDPTDTTLGNLKTDMAFVKSDVGLGNVDNTSDVNKPVSAAQQTAFNLKADLASPALTGNPTAPTAAPGDNDTSIATTAFVTAAVAASGGGDVFGPASSVADAPALFNGTTGKLIKETTYAAFKTSLALGNVDNTSDVNKPVSTAQATADNLRILGPGVVTSGNPVVFSGTTGTAVAQQTFATFKTNLALTKSDVGLSLVDNTADASKPVSTAQAAADATKQPLDATLTALAAFNTNGIIVQTAVDTFAGRTLAAGTGIAVSNGNGVSGNPSIAVDTTAALAWTGLQAFGDGTTNSTVNINGMAGGNRELVMQTAGLARWVVRADAVVEGGANVGSNFSIIARDDTGASIGTALTITRSTRACLINVSVSSPTVIATSAFQFGATAVVGSRKTGWTAATGTATRTTFVTGTVLLPALAEHVKALIDDLITHGLIGT